MKASRIGITPPWPTRGALGAVFCALLLAACQGDDAVAPGGLVSITLSPSSASLGVGQTQTITAEGKDQNGIVLTGLSFTWASSDAGVATVIDGVATGVSAGTASITASSGGVTSNSVTLTVSVTSGTTSRVVIDKASVLLPGSGQTAQLTAQILDPQGAPSAGTVSWSSSAPDKVSVDAAGKLTAQAIGSAQIFAEAAGVRSAPTLVFVANTQPGALLVTDAQVVSVGPPIGLGPGESPGVGTQFEVTLQGVTAPAPGTVVLAAETAPVAGKVVTTRQDPAGLVVTLALTPLYQLFSAYDVALRIDLSAFPVEDLPAGSVRTRPSAAWNAGPRGKLSRLAPGRAFNFVAPFQAFDCDGSIKPQLVSAPIQLSLENKLTLVLEDRPGYSKHALEGSAALVGNAGLKLKAGFKASGSCDAQVQLKLPVFGWFSVVAMPAVRVGLGAGVEGEITLVQGELGVEGKVGFTPVVGWECGGATPTCRGLDDMTPLNQFKTKSAIPDEHGLQAKVSAQFYLLAGLDLSIGAGIFNADILEARVGPEQSFDLAFEEDQVARADYASKYDLKLKGVVEPGGALKKAIEMVIDDDATGVSFKAEFSTDLSESPKGSLSINKATVRPGDVVTFTVALTPSTLEYFLLGYNVTGVELYRKREDESTFTPWKSMTQTASHQATYQWTPAEADAGKYQFAALVNTQVVTPLLEVGPSSIQPLEVSCFSGGAVALVGSLATAVCADTWIGTSSVTLKTPGLPAAHIGTRSNITWTYDPSTSGNGVINYTASGGFELFFGDAGSGCSLSWTPRNFEIVTDPLTPSRLSIIDNGITAPIYTFLGSQMIDFTTTSSCPDRPDVVTEFKGFLVPIAQGNGPFTADLVELSGAADDGVIASTWNFRRP